MTDTTPPDEPDFTASDGTDQPGSAPHREAHGEGRGNGQAPPGDAGDDADEMRHAFDGAAEDSADGSADHGWRDDLPTEAQVRAKPTSVFGKPSLRALLRLQKEDQEACVDLVRALVGWASSPEVTAPKIWDAMKREARTVREAQEASTAKANDDKPPTAELILKWVLSFGELFADQYGQAFIEYRDPNTQVRLTRPVQHTDVIDLLILWPGSQVALPKEVLDTVARTLEARARRSNNRREVHLRFGWHDDELYINRCSADGTVIRVSGTRGVSTIPNTECPLRFMYNVSHGELPVPVPGGSIDELWDLIRVQRPNDKIIVKGFLTGFYDRDGPYPVCGTFGQHGSGKTTGNEFIAGLLDPSRVSPGAISAEEEDMMISLQRDRLGSYDNADRLTTAQISMLCRLNQGTSFSTRMLYTNSREVILTATRMILLNGIQALFTRPDLADRALVVMLDRIPEEDRQALAQLRAAFALARPRILGALLAAIADGLSRPQPVLSRLPRLADHAAWVSRCERGLGMPPGGYIQAMRINAEGAAFDAVTSSYLGEAVVRMQAQSGGKEWSNTPTATLDKLNGLVTERVQRSSGWPQNEVWLTKRLKTLIPALRVMGIVVDPERSVRVKKAGQFQGARHIQIFGQAISEDRADQAKEGDPGDQPENTTATGSSGPAPATTRTQSRRRRRRKSLAENTVDTVDTVDAAEFRYRNIDGIDGIDRIFDQSFPPALPALPVSHDDADPASSVADTITQHPIPLEVAPKASSRKPRAGATARADREKQTNSKTLGQNTVDTVDTVDVVDIADVSDAACDAGATDDVDPDTVDAADAAITSLADLDDGPLT